MNERLDAFLDARFAAFIRDIDELAEDLRSELRLIAAAQRRLYSEVEELRLENAAGHGDILREIRVWHD